VANDNAPAYPVHLDRNHLPEPEWKFPDAKIEMYATESTPDFPPNKQAPKDSANILLVLLDDVGFGWMSVTGGLVRSPTAEKLFKRGLLYNQFHTTALCSPTLAAMLTGRNHHSVATGVIQEMATGHGYCGIIPKGCATFAELLKQSGYTCAWFGKNHNVPDNQTSPAGPFNNWPTNQGFDYLWLHRRRDRPVLSVAGPQHDAGRTAETAGRRLSAHPRSGRRVHRLDSPAESHRARPAIHGLSFNRRSACSPPAAARLAGQECGAL
jgi:arylsulfatase A-like enzyme